MSNVVNLSRRTFLWAGAAVGGLALGVELFRANDTRSARDFQPNAFIRILENGSIVITVGRSEMGQGVFTALPMLIAEELDAQWAHIRVESAPVAPEYDNPAFKMQGTGGSCSVSSSWEPLRQAGATARAMLIAAAAERWKVEPSSCIAHRSLVIHSASRRQLTYGELADAASHLQPPEAIPLKDPKAFTLIGQSLPRVDLVDKSTGRATYGIDVVRADLLVAVVARPPAFGARLLRLEDAVALAVSGVRHVIRIDAGVAIVADDLWSALKGREALRVEWDESALSGFDDAYQGKQYSQRLDETGAIAEELGDASGTYASASTRIDVRYEFPYLAHVCMEPLNCVADVRADHCEVWVGTQFQTYDRRAAAEAAGLKVEQVQLHTMLLGGGFGRRGITDGHFVREAVQISRAIKRPVKVIWSRTDDVRGGYYRPAYQHRLRGALNDQAELTAWWHRIVGQSVLAGTAFMASDGIDRSSYQTPLYRSPHRRIELHTTQLPIPVWAWRSVGSTHSGFAIECFVDELAHLAGKDPVDFRRSLLDPRYHAVLTLAAEKSGWTSALPRGHGRGIAIQKFDSIVAQVAEVSVDDRNELHVHRIVCVADCGTIVNPDIVRAQLEGGIVMGLSAALFEQINFQNGRVVQSNFGDYPILRMNQMPRIEVHLLSSDEPPRGVGEAGVPAVAPAVANAIFAATGHRLRKLPFVLPDKLS